MKRRQHTRTHVFVDVNGAPFPSREDLTIGFAHVAYRAVGEFAARPGDVAPFGVQTPKKLERRSRRHSREYCRPPA
jgi:hypothetical protein